MVFHPVLEFASCTDTGRLRSHNEDAVLCVAQHRLAILADGMGGYNAGEVASRIAIDTLHDVVHQRFRQPGRRWRLLLGKQRRPLLEQAVVHANAGILSAAANEPAYSGMGTTLVAALFGRSRVSIAHVGDARAYRLRRGKLVRLTRDHSVLQEQIDAGLLTEAEARTAPYRNIVTRALGVRASVDVETHDHPLRPGDCYLLCSDGLPDMLTDERILAVVLAHEDNLQAACNTLIDAANLSGGRDNISVILVRIGQAQRGKLSTAALPELSDIVV